jgi:hypothetical protein
LKNSFTPSGLKLATGPNSAYKSCVSVLRIQLHNYDGAVIFLFKLKCNSRRSSPWLIMKLQPGIKMVFRSLLKGVMCHNRLSMLRRLGIFENALRPEDSTGLPSVSM